MGESGSLADEIRNNPALLADGEWKLATSIRVAGANLAFRDDLKRLHLVAIVEGTADDAVLDAIAAAPGLLRDRLGENEVFAPRAWLVAREIPPVVQDRAIALHVKWKDFPLAKPRDGAATRTTSRVRPTSGGSALRLPSYQELSKEQDQITNLAVDGRFLVIGPPGTGKTVMALYRAWMLKRRRRRPVKLLMYSRLLTQYTESAIAQLGLNGTVQTYHKWFYDLYKNRYHTDPPELTRYQFDFGEVLKVIADDPPHLDSTSDLLVDEGQDLPKEFYAISRQLAKNAVVFADENQRITEFNSTTDEIRIFGGLTGPLRLTKNYRNTQEIAKLAGHFYTGLPSGLPELPDRKGEVPVMRHFEQVDTAAESIRIFERNNPTLTIGVFTPTKKLQERIVDLLGNSTKNPVQFYVGGQGARGTPLDFTRPGVMVINYQSVKGLEFDAVFIPEIQDIGGDLAPPDIRMRLYVLISRARQRLQISYSGSGSPPILDLFPRNLLEWR